MAQQLAVMRGVRYGAWGMHKPGLCFETWLPDGSATLQLLSARDASRLMAAAGVDRADVTALEGRSCRVEVDGYRVRFVGLAEDAKAGERAIPVSAPLDRADIALRRGAA